jgi:hypothetical protein
VNISPVKSRSVLVESPVGRAVAGWLPLLHLHGGAQTDSPLAEMQILICAISSVRFSGAQKSESGIKDIPLLHMQSPMHSAATFGRQAAKSSSAVASLILTGWQNSLVKSGVGPVGAIGLTGVVGCSSTGFHSQIVAKLAHPAWSATLRHLSSAAT